MAWKTWREGERKCKGGWALACKTSGKEGGGRGKEGEDIGVKNMGALGDEQGWRIRQPMTRRRRVTAVVVEVVAQGGDRDGGGVEYRCKHV